MTCTHCNKPAPDCDCETMAGIYEAAGKAGDEMYVLLRDGMYYRRDGDYTGRLKDARQFSRDMALPIADFHPWRFSALPVSTAPRHAPKCDPHVIALDLKADADKALEAERAARVAAEAENARLREVLGPFARFSDAARGGGVRLVNSKDGWAFTTPLHGTIFSLKTLTQQHFESALAALTQPPSPTGEMKGNDMSQELDTAEFRRLVEAWEALKRRIAETQPYVDRQVAFVEGNAEQALANFLLSHATALLALVEDGWRPNSLSVARAKEALWQSGSVVQIGRRTLQDLLPPPPPETKP